MNDESAIFAEAARLADSGSPFAIASIVASQGSTPRSTARMLVRGDATTLGTIGGGIVESRVVSDALECMKTGRSRVIRYVLDSCSGQESLAMLCGGSMEVFIDVAAPRQRLVIIGAGHVGLALAKLADFAGFRVAIVDERRELVTKERFSMAVELYCEGDLVEALNALPTDPDAAFVIATHSDDERALRTMIGGQWSYLGMLGSRRKVKILFDKLGQEGFPKSLLARVRAPIGLDIGAETPEEIAISILAEILADMRKASTSHFAGEMPNS
ncbi:MAG TPA: XdhC/CoxI family protein [Rectinemataceae bacterium]|nr:XdhC/CoxI family protein [Rectinemataceae bacterium]